MLATQSSNRQRVEIREVERMTSNVRGIERGSVLSSNQLGCNAAAFCSCMNPGAKCRAPRLFPSEGCRTTRCRGRAPHWKAHGSLLNGVRGASKRLSQTKHPTQAVRGLCHTLKYLLSGEALGSIPVWHARKRLKESGGIGQPSAAGYKVRVS